MSQYNAGIIFLYAVVFAYAGNRIKKECTNLISTLNIHQHLSSVKHRSFYIYPHCRMYSRVTQLNHYLAVIGYIILQLIILQDEHLII